MTVAIASASSIIVRTAAIETHQAWPLVESGGVGEVFARDEELLVLGPLFDTEVFGDVLAGMGLLRGGEYFAYDDAGGPVPDWCRISLTAREEPHDATRVELAPGTSNVVRVKAAVRTGALTGIEAGEHGPVFSRSRDLIVLGPLASANASLASLAAAGLAFYDDCFDLDHRGGLVPSWCQIWLTMEHSPRAQAQSSSIV